MPAARAMAAATSAGSRTGANATKITPSPNEGAAADALAIASRVLPTPPGPVSASNREERARSASASAAISCSRPNRVSTGAGNVAWRPWGRNGTAATGERGAAPDGSDEDMLMATLIATVVYRSHVPAAPQKRSPQQSSSVWHGAPLTSKQHRAWAPMLLTEHNGVVFVPTS